MRSGVTLGDLFGEALAGVFSRPWRSMLTMWLDSEGHSKMTEGAVEASTEMGGEFSAWLLQKAAEMRTAPVGFRGGFGKGEQLRLHSITNCNGCETIASPRCGVRRYTSTWLVRRLI